MQKTLAEIAQLINGEVIGDKDVVITGINGIEEAGQGDLTFIANSKYIPLAKTTSASAIIVSRDIDIPGKILIKTDNPSFAFSAVVSAISDESVYRPQGIHESAVIDPSANIGQNVSIGPATVIEKDVVIGDNTYIYGNVYIAHGSRLGNDCLIYPHVSIRERSSVGDRVTIHNGTVVGSDGFGYAQINGEHKKIPQIGTVLIEDDVEIGANVTIDRARFDKTIIGQGSKIDNLVQIAHNVIIGKNCIVVALVGISGSTKIGNGAILAGQVGTAGHLTIGEGCVVAARTGVTKDIPPHTKVSGFPAKPHIEAQRINASIQKLPGYVKEINELKKRIEELEQKIQEK